MYKFLFALLLIAPLLIYFSLGGAFSEYLDFIWYINRRMDISTNPVLTGYLLNGYLVQLPFAIFLVRGMNVFKWKNTPTIRSIVLINLVIIFVLLICYIPLIGGNFSRSNSDFGIFFSSAVMYGYYSPFAIYFIFFSANELLRRRQ